MENKELNSLRLHITAILEQLASEEKVILKNEKDNELSSFLLGFIEGQQKILKEIKIVLC